MDRHVVNKSLGIVFSLNVDMCGEYSLLKSFFAKAVHDARGKLVVKNALKKAALRGGSQIDVQTPDR